MLVDTFGDDAVEVVDAELGGSQRAAQPPGERPFGECEGGLRAEELITIQGVEDGQKAVPPAISTGALRRNEAVPFDEDDPGTIENLALLVEGDEVVAGSTLEELTEAVLLVNSDLYVTGSRKIQDLRLPAVITGLEDAVFTLRGYPESNRQKLLLITISRFIERAAWTAGDGTLRSSFQRLSRLDDEIGTRRVYENVADAGVDAHLYGVPDDLPRDLDAVVHGGDSRDFHRQLVRGVSSAGWATSAR